MSDDLILEDLEQDQQDLMEKSDITTLAKYCNDLARIENNISSHERTLKDLKEQADKISSEIIPNLLAEQGLSSLKLADGSGVDVKKTYSCTIKKDSVESAYTWLRDQGLGDIIKNEVSVVFGKGEDTRANELLSLAEQEGYQPNQKQKVEPMTLKALYRERIEAGLDMPSEHFHTFVKDQTKISRKS
tara:strand:+ start:1692 stop:2255 length:564 start_codon:yes stop_codon:yes gene_type:complete